MYLILIPIRPVDTYCNEIWWIEFGSHELHIGWIEFYINVFIIYVFIHSISDLME